MKTRIIIPLLLAFSVAAGYAQSPKSPLEGTWEMTSAKWTENGKEMSSPSPAITIHQLKMYSPGHFVFVGQNRLPDKVQERYGGGTYTLNGEDYTETILYHSFAGIVGTTLHFKLVVKGNTMTLTGPIVTEEQKSFRSEFTEVYQKKD